MAHSKFRETCTGRVLRIANYVAVGLLGLGFILRFVYMFTDEVKGPNYSGFWFFMATLFYGGFLALLGLSLHPDEENKFGLLVRVHFRVLDFDFGRGLFIFYLAMQMCEVHSNGEVFFAVFVCIVAIVDMIQGFMEFKENVMSIPNSQEAGRDIDQPDDD